jgi:hypothetical protein
MDKILKLEKENQLLKEEIKKLKLKLTMKDEKLWAHPKSCIHNCDPWETWTSPKLPS